MPESSHVSLVTGATGALGRATATALAKAGGTVLLVARDRTRGDAAVADVARGTGSASVELVIGDLSSMESIRTLARDVAQRHPQLHVLFNAAAVFNRSRVVTPDGYELMFATNVLGPFLLTNLLLDALRGGSPSRVITVSAPSTTPVDFDDLQGSRRFRPLHAFGATKSADLLFAYELARRLEGTGVTSNVFFPGLVKSGLMRSAPAPVRFFARLGSKPPERAAAAASNLALAPEYERVTSTYFKLEKVSDSSAYSRDPAHQRRLWEAATRLVGLE